MQFSIYRHREIQKQQQQQLEREQIPLDIALYKSILFIMKKVTTRMPVF
ncbi:hypothetical protein PP707_02020 [Acetobacter pasteurianus]|nr:hypothetical protein [Acetobacter pasteurianus]